MGSSIPCKAVAEPACDSNTCKVVEIIMRLRAEARRQNLDMQLCRVKCLHMAAAMALTLMHTPACMQHHAAV